MFIQVTDAHDGERFLLNTAYLRGIYPFPANGMPRMARSVAVFKSKDEDSIPLTESVSTIACLLRGELPPVDIEGLR